MSRCRQEAGLSIEGDSLEFPRYMINVAADIPPEEVPLQPWAEELFHAAPRERRHRDPVAHCKPTGLPLLNTLPVPFKLVQTPDLV